MKVVALNGSPRRNGNTAMLINTVFGELQKAGIETELVQLGGNNIKPCRACAKCAEAQDKTCVTGKDDILNEYLQKMIEADGIIIGSPTYFSNVTPEVKALIDRAGTVSIVNGYLLQRKVGAAVVAVRRDGATDVFDAINKFYFINQVIVPGSAGWNIGFGFSEGEVKDDGEGMHIMRVLGENMAWLLQKVNA